MDFKANRRDSEERRGGKDDAEFPFRDSQGRLIAFDRRNKDDRRTGILVTQATMSEQEFAEYYKNRTS